MKSNNAIIALTFGGGLLFLASRASARSSKVKSVQLTKNFNESEFKNSPSMPSLASYALTPAEASNLLALALVLQDGRDLFGPMHISSGGRPSSLRNSKGQTFYESLVAKGYRPAQNSDHDDFSAADFQVGDMEKAYIFFKNHPRVRQVILYRVNGIPKHIHLAVVRPGKPRLSEKRYAFVDSKTVKEAAVS